jgi:hypothetical protein
MLRACRERCWRCESFTTARQIEDRVRPLDGVAHTDAAWLRLGPEFEIDRTDVVLHAVAVMDGLTGHEVPTDESLGYDDGLEDVAALPGARMAVALDHHVSGLVAGPASLPVPIQRVTFGSAGRTRQGVELLRPTARALGPRSA